MMTQMYKQLVSFLSATQLPGHNRIILLDVSSELTPHSGKIVISFTLDLISENAVATWVIINWNSCFRTSITVAMSFFGDMSVCVCVIQWGNMSAASDDETTSRLRLSFWFLFSAWNFFLLWSISKGSEQKSLLTALLLRGGQHSLGHIRCSQSHLSHLSLVTSTSSFSEVIMKSLQSW